MVPFLFIFENTTAKGCHGRSLWPCEMARDALDAGTIGRCLRHGTTVPILDGNMVASRLHVAVQVRCKTRKALKHRRYRRLALLVNLRRSARRTDKVDQVSRALCPPAATHLGITSGKHLFDLEPALSQLLKLTSTQPWSVLGHRV